MKDISNGSCSNWNDCRGYCITIMQIGTNYSDCGGNIMERCEGEFPDYMQE